MPSAIQSARPRQAAVAAPAPRAARPAGAGQALAFLRNREAPPPTLEAAARRLGDLAQRLEARGDRRAVFAAVYEMQVRDMARELTVPGRYADPAWMTQLSLDFVQRYFETFRAYERGERARVPAAWQTAFDHAREGRGPLLNDMVLAMNAHVNHDLALSAAATGADVAHRTDFLRFNDVMKRNVDQVQDLLETRFLSLRGSLVRGADAALGPVDEWAAGALISAWRGQAWQHALALTHEGEAAYGAIQARSRWNARTLDALGHLVPPSWVRRGLI